MISATRKVALFVVVGGTAAAVNLIARILINRITTYEVAIVLAFAIASTFAFVLNRLFVFEQGGTAWRAQFLRFLFVNVVTLVQVFALSELFARVIFPATDMRFHPDTVAHGIGLLSPILTSYFAHKHFTFAGTEQRA